MLVRRKSEGARGGERGVRWINRTHAEAGFLFIFKLPESFFGCCFAGHVDNWAGGLGTFLFAHIFGEVVPVLFSEGVRGWMRVYDRYNGRHENDRLELWACVCEGAFEYGLCASDGCVDDGRGVFEAERNGGGEVSNGGHAFVTCQSKVMLELESEI
jgi:hypothetical protein